MTNAKAPNVRLHPLAHDALKRLLGDLESEIGVRANQADVVSALIYGATPAQTSGMLPVFLRHAKAADATVAAASEDGKM